MATPWARASLLLGAGAVLGFALARYTAKDAVPVTAPASTPDQPVTVAAPPAITPAAPARAQAAERPDLSTLAEILRLDSDFDQTAALYALIRRTDSDELERLIAEADSVPGASDRRAALSILYGRYADLDPAAALAFLEGRGGSYGNLELRSIFHAWARKDLASAVEAAGTLEGEMRTVAGAAILTSRDDISGAARRDIAQQLDIEDVLSRIAMQQSLDEVDRDPLAAWREALAAGGGVQQHQRLGRIAQGWARDDPMAAMDAAMALPQGNLRIQLQRQILYQWSRQNPRAAVDWVLGQAPSPQRRHLAAAALSAMAEQDPRVAFDIAQSLDGRERSDALGQVLARWATDDPAAAARSLELVTSPQARSNAVGQIASAYANRDPQGALDWIASLDAQEATHATMNLFTVLAHQQPAEAGRLLTRLPDDERRRFAAGAVGQAWAQQDPEAAARWADSLVDPEVRRQAVSSLVQQWANFDRDAAVTYAERIPGRAERDAALVSIIQTQHADVAFAERLFERLTDPGQRRQAARQLYFSLNNVDPARAERYREMAGVGVQPATTR